MILRNCIERIRFATSTLNDVTGKSVNALFSDRNIAQQLQDVLDIYASETLAIEAIYSLPLNSDLKYIDAPPLALRAKTYKMIIAYIGGRAYPLNVPNMNDAISQFPYEISGIPRFVLPWQNWLYFFPTNSNDYYTAILGADIDEVATTITFDVNPGFLSKNGIITLGEEKIRYQYISGTSFYECERGYEDTTPAKHYIGDTIEDNNLHIFYYKKHWVIPVLNNGAIDPVYLNKEMEVCDEHIRTIISYTTYLLLLKIDVRRAEAFKVEFEEWLPKAKDYIRSGRNRMSNSGMVQAPYQWQTNTYLGQFL